MRTIEREHTAQDIAPSQAELKNGKATKNTTPKKKGVKQAKK